MENQMKLIAQLKKVARDNDYTILDIEKWLGLKKNYFYKASGGQLKLDQGILNQIRKKIELFERTGIFKLIDRPRQIIDYDLLHEIDKDYMTNNGSWDPKAYDDPRLKYVLYYEDVDK